MVAGTATCSENLFAVQICQQELRDEKAPLFGLWRACWDNNLAFWRICGDGQAKRDRRPPAAISAPLKTNGQSSKKTAKDCDDEWRADQATMMKHGMTAA